MIFSQCGCVTVWLQYLFVCGIFLQMHLHGVVWCEANSIPDDVTCATMPRESDGFDPKFTTYLRDLYKECNMVHQCYPDKFQYWSWACMHQVQVGLSL